MAGLLGTAYRDLSALLSALTDEEGWQPTGCAGWTPVDLGGGWGPRTGCAPRDGC